MKKTAIKFVLIASVIITYWILFAPKQYFSDEYCLKVGPYCEYFSSNLRAMKEPSLYKKASNIDNLTYRFLWLRSFNEPASFRLAIQPDNTATLSIKMLDLSADFSSGIYVPGKLILDKEVTINRADLEEFLVSESAAKKWLTKDKVPAPNAGFDGASWIFEAVIDHQHHIIQRWSPTSTKENSPAAAVDYDMQKLGMALMKLSGIKFEHIY